MGSVPNVCLILEYLAVKAMQESPLRNAKAYLVELLEKIDRDAIPEVELFVRIALAQYYSERGKPEHEERYTEQAFLIEERMGEVPEAWRSVLGTAQSTVVF